MGNPKRIGRKSLDVIINAEHDDPSGTNRISEGGFVPDQIFGNNSATAQYIGKGTTIRCTNLSGAAAYVAFGDVAVGAPLVTTGVAIPDEAVVYLHSGENTHVRTSHNGVQVVTVKE